MSMHHDGPDDSQAAARHQLCALREEFPQYRIWREMIGDRARHVARRLHAGTGPHTLVTADPGELRAGLSASPAQPRWSSGRTAAAAATADAATGARENPMPLAGSRQSPAAGGLA